MKMHTTNYYNTLILVAEDCPCTQGEMPPMKKDTKTIANLQFDVLYEHDYQFSSDEILFQVHAHKNEIPRHEYEEAFANLFSKGQACFRASPLTKRYGWGVHFNAEGKMALIGMETKRYQELKKDKTLQLVKAMRTSKSSS